jgi:hypothetical protein
MHIVLHVKYIFSCPILTKLEFLDRFSKILQVSNSVKIRPARADLFHADGQTDRWTDSQTWAKLTLAFHNREKCLKQFETEISRSIF